MFKITFRLIAVFLAFFILYPTTQANYDEIIRSKEEQLLIEKLLKNYNKQLRPPGNKLEFAFGFCVLFNFLIIFFSIF